LLSSEFSLSEYTKIDVSVGWGFVPDPTWGAYSAPQTLYSWFQGAASRQEGSGGRGGLGERGRVEGKRKGE